MSTSRTLRASMALALMSFAVACGDSSADTASAPGTVVRDSAGVAIVENAAPGDRTGGIALAAEPEVAIGVLEGAPEYQLFQVMDAMRLSDGRIVVLNSGSSEVRYYGADGAFLSATGAQGEGPGEFRSVGFAYRMPADSLLVYDFQTRRLSLLDGQGTFVESSALQAPNAFPFPVGLVTPDTMLVRTSRAFGMMAEGPQEGVRKDSSDYTLVAWRADSATAPTPLLTLPSADVYTQVGGTETNRSIRMGPVFMAADPVMIAQDGRLYYGLSDRYEIQLMDGDGTLERIVRLGHEAQPITPELRERAVEAQLRGMEDENARKRQRESLEAMPVPEFLPAFDQMLVGEDGRIWTQRVQFGADQPDVWDVFDADGTWVAAVEMPAMFRPVEAGRDYVLGVARDEFDVEQVRLYPLITEQPADA